MARPKLLFLMGACILLFGVFFTGCGTQEYSLSVNAGIGGTIPAGHEETINGDYPKGARIEILARPMEGYCFTHWTSSDGGYFDNAEESTTYFVMPANDTVVTAHFSALEP